MSDPLGVLQRIRTTRPRAGGTTEQEACDLCAEPIPSVHGHLVDLHSRRLLCACRGCSLLFETGGAGHYRSIPDRYVDCGGAALTKERWDALQIPVDVAFFFFNSALGRVAAFYPGPAGATESELALEAWTDLAAAMPELASMQPDVEALLVRGGAGFARAECYIVPIDACYELVGTLRLLWRGFNGGAEAARKLNEFFAQVEERAR